MFSEAIRNFGRELGRGVLPAKSDLSYSDDLLRVSGLRHSYRTRSGELLALDGLDLRLSAGEVVCLLGASGSGKSTALRVLAGLERPHKGDIFFAGCHVCGAGVFVPPERRRMGLVFQDFALFPHLNVGENIAYGLSGRGTDRVKELLEVMDLRGYGEKYPHELSGGEAQRVALARALAPEPLLLLMDEPFSGLDARLRDSVRDWVLHILKDRNIGAVIVTHDSEEALYMSDRITVIDCGSMLQSGTPDELYSHPINSFVAEFFGQVNKIHRRVEGGRIETPFGIFACPEIKDGDCVNLLFRPEHLILREHVGSDEDDDALPEGVALARVEASRMLGRTSLVHLQVWHEGSYSLHMHARVQGRYVPSEGILLRLHLQRDSVFIFHESC